MSFDSTIARITTRIHGARSLSNLELRIFVISTLYGGITCLVYATTNLLIGLHYYTYVAIYPAGALLLLCYGTARFKSNSHQWYRRLIIPMILLLNIVIIQVWFMNGGMVGATHYFLFAMVSVMMVLVRGWKKVWFLFAYLGVVGGMVYIHFYQPQLITGYKDPKRQFIDLLIGIPGAMFILALVVGSVKRNFDRVVKRIQKNRTELLEDLNLASDLQKRVYEYDPAIVRGFDFAFESRPSNEVGGDLIDLVRTSPDSLRILLADARGHGINASLSAMLIKSEWANISHSPLSPAKALWLLNRRMTHRYGDTITFSAVVVDINPGQIVYTSAGHSIQFLTTPYKILELDSSGPPLGMLEEYDWTEETHEFEKKSGLILFTDALFEELDGSGKAMGIEWLQDTVAKLPADFNAQQKVNKIMKVFSSRLGQSVERLTTADDLTLLVISPRSDASALN